MPSIYWRKREQLISIYCHHVGHDFIKQHHILPSLQFSDFLGEPESPSSPSCSQCGCCSVIFTILIPSPSPALLYFLEMGQRERLQQHTDFWDGAPSVPAAIAIVCVVFFLSVLTPITVALFLLFCGGRWLLIDTDVFHALTHYNPKILTLHGNGPSSILVFSLVCISLHLFVLNFISILLPCDSISLKSFSSSWYQLLNLPLWITVISRCCQLVAAHLLQAIHKHT